MPKELAKQYAPQGMDSTGGAVINHARAKKDFARRM